MYFSKDNPSWYTGEYLCYISLYRISLDEDEWIDIPPHKRFSVVVVAIVFWSNLFNFSCGNMPKKAITFGLN